MNRPDKILCFKIRINLQSKIDKAQYALVSKGLLVVMFGECLKMFSCCYPGFASFLRFKHHSSFSNQSTEFP